MNINVTIKNLRRPDDGLRLKLLSLFVLIFEYTYLTDSMRLWFLIITLIESFT